MRIITKATADNAAFTKNNRSELPARMPTQLKSSPHRGALSASPKVLNLLEACRAGCHSTAAAICSQLSAEEKAVHCSTTDPTGWSLLLYAARNGWQDLAEACLAAGQSPHSTRLQSSGNGALHLAALHGHLDVARVLLAALQRHNQELQHTQEQLQSPPCSPAALKRLPTPAATASSSRSKTQPGGVASPPAAAAADERNTAAADSAAAKPAAVHIPGVDVRNFNGDTPLMFATSSGHLGVAALLLNVSVPSAVSAAAPVCLGSHSVQLSFGALLDTRQGLQLAPSCKACTLQGDMPGQTRFPSSPANAPPPWPLTCIACMLLVCPLCICLSPPQNRRAPSPPYTTRPACQPRWQQQGMARPAACSCCSRR